MNDIKGLLVGSTQSPEVLILRNMLKKLNSKRGFTLIELLVVIAIIGILSGIVVTSLGSQRARARDSRKVSELGSVALALQIFYDQNGRYPTVAATDTGSTDGIPAELLPKTPVNTDGTSYIIYKPYVSAARTGAVSTDCVAGNCKGYHLAAELEQADAVIFSGDDDKASAGLDGTDDTKNCDVPQVVEAGALCYDLVNK